MPTQHKGPTTPDASVLVSRLCVALRRVSDEAERLQAEGDWLQGGPGYPVGSEGAYHPALACAMRDMLRGLYEGLTLEDSYQVAAQHLRQWVSNVSAKRNDIEWKRDPEHRQDALLRAKHTLLRALDMEK